MTQIGRKLYLGFGAILAIMPWFLFVLNILTISVIRENSARDAVSQNHAGRRANDRNGSALK